MVLLLVGAIVCCATCDCCVLFNVGVVVGAVGCCCRGCVLFV